MNNALWDLVNKIPNIKYTTEWDHLNYNKIPTTVIEAMPGNEDQFNDIYTALLGLSNFKQIKRTNSGGISMSVGRRFMFDQYDIKQVGPVLELTIITLEKSCRIQWRLKNYKDENEDKKLVSASYYYKRYWLPKCKKYNINMTDYFCSPEDGLEAKKQIHKPDINIYNNLVRFTALQNVHHLDFHKFYISGLINTHPEFRPVVEDLLKDKQNEKIHKTGLASLIGLFQSPVIQYRLAKLSKDAINDAYVRYDEVKDNLVKDNRKIILTNTDGIWYQGELYHGKYESSELLGWSNDHKDCTLIAKSAGSYQYIEDNKVNTVVRGYTRRDRIIPRSEWEFGDIFDPTVKALMWKFEKDVGIKWQE